MIAEMSLVLDIDNSFQHEGPKGQKAKDLTGSFSLTLRTFDPLCRDKIPPLNALRESAIAAGVTPARVLDLLAAALRAGGDHLLRVNHGRVGRDRVGDFGRRRLWRGLSLDGLRARPFGRGARGIWEIHQAALGEHDAFGHDLLR